MGFKGTWLWKRKFEEGIRDCGKSIKEKLREEESERGKLIRGKIKKNKKQ